MRGPDHVGGHEINQSVVIEIANISAHRGPWSVRNDLPDNVGERAIAVVAIELVGAKIIIGDIEIRPAVTVEIPPERREREERAVDACLRSDFGKPTTIVAIEMVELSCLSGHRPLSGRI